MTENQLKLNDDKTAETLLVPLSSSLKPSTVSLPDWLDYSWPTTSPSLILPGTSDQFILDCPWRSTPVIKSCQTAYFELKCINSIHRFLTKMQPRLLLLPISSHGSGLLQLSPHGYTRFRHPTSPKNSKLCCKTHSLGTPPPTPHWLPISERIKYKVACMCFNATNGSGPAYLSELLHVYTPSHTKLFFWHTHDENPTIQTRDSWLSHLSCFGPQIWNSLPQDHFAQPRHLSKPNWKPSSSHSIFAPISVPSFCYKCVCVCYCTLYRQLWKIITLHKRVRL